MNRFVRYTIFLFTCLLPLAVQAVGVVPLDSAPAGTVETSLTLGQGIYRIINNLLVIVAVVALIVMVLGGVRYIISQGDEDQVRQAKNTILYGAIGLLVIGLAAVAVNFVIRSYKP